MKDNKKLIFFALAVAGDGISGSDRIFVEFARRWSSNYPVKIITSFEGKRFCKKMGLSGKFLEIVTIPNKNLTRYFLLNYLYKILYGVWLGITLPLKGAGNRVFIYSASEFWMDSLPAFFLKVRNSNARWAAAWYQTAPSPLKGFAEGERERKYLMSALTYWLVQLPIKPLIANFADCVLVNNEEEKKKFPGLLKKSKAIVVLGAVDLASVGKFRKGTESNKLYGAVFQGRFHPQKGVLELIEIWKKVNKIRKDAKLAMIGDGPLMRDVKLLIAKYKLGRNIELFGFVYDGPQKFKIFSQSKIVVHPAFYDSGGMAAAEAMAFGIPAVGFDLGSFKSYYPKGMVKVEVGNLGAFAREILHLLENDEYRGKVAKEGVEMLEKNWSWDVRANEILTQITS